ncbi:hypothetical protein [Escherichia coli]|uniref:hypothetical protein n=1 Tax=Escherichia coli TaxID=562 RepID=UPI000BE4E518|nr:hypothetical protein [Escherichia coli]EFB3581100.1 hypothetical protein [Escherichia coli]
MDELIEELNEKTRSAGFIKLPHFPPLPESIVAYWQSEYACIGLMRCDGVSQEEFESSRIEGEKVLDSIARRRERPGVTIDATLILALPGGQRFPSSTIRNAELDTRLVRKHVVWIEEDKWQRIGRITLLGLPCIANDIAYRGFTRVSQSTLEFLSEFEGMTPAALARKHTSGGEDGNE